MISPNTTITIPVERYAELIKAEREAECLKAFLYCRFKDYGSISYEELRMLHALYFPEVCKDVADT